MDYETAVYHGVRQNLRRVLNALGNDRIELGLTAFEDGVSNWTGCFFARAFKNEARVGTTATGHHIDPTLHICTLLNDPGYKLKVPVKILWHTFDSAQSSFGGKNLSRQDLRKFIEDVLDESRPSEVMNLLRGINYDKVEEKEFACHSM